MNANCVTEDDQPRAPRCHVARGTYRDAVNVAAGIGPLTVMAEPGEHEYALCVTFTSETATLRRFASVNSPVAVDWYGRFRENRFATIAKWPVAEKGAVQPPPVIGKLNERTSPNNTTTEPGRPM